MNRECRCRKGINEEIEMEERKEHFIIEWDEKQNSKGGAERQEKREEKEVVVQRRVSGGVKKVEGWEGDGWDHERFGDMGGRGGGVKVSDLERRGVAR